MKNDQLIAAVRTATESGKLMPSAAENLIAWSQGGLPAWATESIAELVTRGEWAELNDRFYRYLEFGTGGMRGRTVGAVPAKAETGQLSPLGSPEHAGVGCNMLNDFTLIRATLGLFRYVSKYLATQKNPAKPRIVIAHDVRHFSRHFCELAASTWIRLGGEAYIFDGPRSTPQLSYSVRWLKAHTGVVITASHNPPHDNGYKAYFDDGAQVTPPHDTGIIAEVNAVPLSAVGEYLEKNLSQMQTLGREADDAYLAVAAQAAIDHDLVRKSGLRVVYTNIHGVGAVSAVPLLAHAGVRVTEVPEQAQFDPRFPTVKSPNPENPEALALAIALAEKGGHDVVMATDPDDDRMGVAVRNKAGKLELLTGNQVGVLLADYRITKYKELGWIPKEGTQSACLIKTFVTTPLQDAVGRAHGVKVINTLTGFKWIASKMRGYEQKLTAAMGVGFNYDNTPFRERARLLQHVSKAIAGVNMRLTAGGVRELHWHTAGEWAIMLYGTARITSIDNDGKSFVADVKKDDLWFFPSGIPHSIQGLEPDGCEFLLVFDDGNFSEAETVLLSDSMAHLPPDVLSKNFGLSQSALNTLARQELFIFQTDVPGPLEDDQKTAAGDRGKSPIDFAFRTMQMPPTKATKSGEVRIVDSNNFKVSSTAMAMVTVHPGGLRELHWHPNADEWQYYISGKGRMTVVATGNKARTMDFQAGDVGYVDKTLLHYVENTGDTDLVFLEMFKSEHYKEFSFSEWLAHTPPELVAAHLNASVATVNAIPRNGAVVMPE